MSLIDDIVIRREKVILSSGKESDLYIDVKPALTKRDNLHELALELGYGKMLVAEGTLDDAASNGFDSGDGTPLTISIEPEETVAGVAIGGIPIATAVCMECWNEMAVVRSEKKKHGVGDLIIGNVEGKHVVVIDDVATSGGSIIKAIRALRAAGAIVRKAIVIVDRDEGAARAITREKVLFAHLYSAEELLKQK